MSVAVAHCFCLFFFSGANDIGQQGSGLAHPCALDSGTRSYDIVSFDFVEIPAYMVGYILPRI